MSTYAITDKPLQYVHECYTDAYRIVKVVGGYLIFYTPVEFRAYAASIAHSGFQDPLRTPKSMYTNPVYIPSIV